MSNLQFQPNYSTLNKSNSTQGDLTHKDFPSFTPISTSVTANISAETDAEHNNKKSINRNMNYDTTPTPSFKLINNNSNNNSNTNNDKPYYQHQMKENDSNWLINNNRSENNVNIDEEIQQRHMQQLFDKKRKRRESHNAVERRRRDNINERIFELSTLLPERDSTKNNKGTILRKSVDHIKLLHDKVNQYQQRIQELENLLNIYRIRWGDIDLNNNNSNNNVYQR